MWCHPTAIPVSDASAVEWFGHNCALLPSCIWAWKMAWGRNDSYSATLGHVRGVLAYTIILPEKTFFVTALFSDSFIFVQTQRKESDPKIQSV